MASGRSVVINGDLGSGKSTVSTLLARLLGIRRISVGDAYRDMAKRRGLTALDLNLHAELDGKIDHYVDELQCDVALSGDTVVVDSRLAWFFFHDALKVHLITDSVVAAQRVLARPATTVESYASIKQARDRLAARSESERMRFIERYGVDKTQLRNYDLVCDSTRATPEEIVARIVDALRSPMEDGRPLLHIDPRRVHIDHGRDDHDADAGRGPIQLGYARPHFFLVTGQAKLDVAASRGDTLVKAILATEADEVRHEHHAEEPLGGTRQPPTR
jgi:CMP/dCMP kinase